MAQADYSTHQYLTKLLSEKKYTDLRDFMLKRHPVSTPFEIMMSAKLSYIDALLCRHLSTLDGETVSKIEGLNLSCEEIIALKGASGEVLDTALEELRKDAHHSRSAGLINKMVIDLEGSVKDDILFKLDRFRVAHMGKKAQEFKQIGRSQRGVLRSVGNYILKSRNFKSEKQKKFFVDTLRVVYRCEVLKRPCKTSKETCKICRESEDILREYFGPLEELE